MAALMYARVNKETLRFIRDRKQVSFDYVEKITKYPKTKVSLWEDESSDTFPTIRQAKELAKCYRVPFAGFYMNSTDINVKHLPKIVNKRSMMIGTQDDSAVNLALLDLMNDRDFFVETKEALHESILLKADITKTRKKDLRKLLVFFDEVETIDLYSANWSMQYRRNNQTYRMLISICYLVVKGLLQTQSDGTTKLMDFLDEQRMHRLYEKFILEYYRREYPQITANASQIPWQLDDDMGAMLPVMQSDIMLSYGEKTLIIDAKYYSHSTQIQYDKHTIHSGNMYQIFTYVKNKEIELADQPHEVSGMLLYARTDEDVYPENEYHMSGNKIEVRTLNLDGDFASIKGQLDEIAEKYLNVKAA